MCHAFAYSFEYKTQQKNGNRLSMAKILKDKYEDRVQNQFTYITFIMHNKDRTRM